MPQNKNEIYAFPQQELTTDKYIRFNLAYKNIEVDADILSNRTADDSAFWCYQKE